MKDLKESIRLQKYIADQGVCSRRQAEALIEEGRVQVNGQLAHLGQKILPGEDRVHVRGRNLGTSPQRTVVLAMNKPKGYISSNSDPHHDRTVFDLVPPPWNRERLFCAGRLDKDSDGLLILTNDGELAQRLQHPSNEIIKRYKVTLTKPFQEAHIKIMLNGVMVDGERLKAEKIVQIKKGPLGDRTLEIHLGHGKKREIRRMVEALGYYVKRLQRFQIGDLRMRGISSGRVRELSKKEVELLFS
ncbi:MAG: rRNA pseudouridine synthase [Opitutales bacterium]|nr:rRNA pseudouridine synthase [Opitutales bacterium]